MSQNFEEIANNEFIQNLEDRIYDFMLNKFFDKTNEGNFRLFAYKNDAAHRSVEVYYHSETNEFRVQIHVGLNTFCLSEFFTSDFSTFVSSLKAELPKVIRYYNFFDGTEDELVLNKNFSKWSYGNSLPDNIGEFELFIRPSKALEITNGSFVIIDYCDFSTNSDLVIYYNVFQDDFSGELRINGTTTVISDFDVDNLKDLEKQLNLNMNNCLNKIRSQIKKI